jgi:hypothetical protein
MVECEIKFERFKFKMKWYKNFLPNIVIRNMSREGLWDHRENGNVKMSFPSILPRKPNLK